MNTRSPAYKARKTQALALMSEEPNLIKRPLVMGKKVVFGYKPDEYGKLG